jgi:hypothetical protein
MPRVIEDHDEVAQDENDGHYLFVRGETHLHCTTCGQEVEMLQCKCGKFGPRSYMEAHIDGRKAKGTPSALAAHKLVETTVPDVGIMSVNQEVEQYEVKEGARKKKRTR